MLTILYANLAMGQTEESIRERIMAYGSSTSVMISKGRQMLHDYFLEDDIPTVKEIKDYLVTFEDRDYMVFYPAEHWILLLWTREYRELAKEILRFDTTSYEVYLDKLKPLRDMLYRVLMEQTLVYETALRRQITESDADPETKQLTLLVVDWLLLQTRDDIYAQDRLNDQADAFMKAYPHSEVNNFIREYIRLKYIPADWGIGVEYFTGFGLLTGNLAKEYTHNVPIGIGMSIVFRNMELNWRLYAGFTKTKKEMPYSLGVFEKGSWVNLLLPEISLGYAVYQNNRIRILPFTGIGWMSIAPDEPETSKIPALKEVALPFTFTHTLGYSVDIKLGPKHPPVYDPKTYFGVIRIRYGYTRPQFDKKPGGVSGNMHYLTIGIGLEGRGKKEEI